MILDPINDPDNHEDEDETAFPCACGDPACIGHNDDAGNIKLGSAWYASDCAMANAHPEVVREREADARRDMWRGK
jgi:hypothetical protein